MAYFTQEDLSALIPEGYLTEGLDDQSTGEADAFVPVQRLVENRVNGILGQRYPVPFDVSGNAGLASFLNDVCAHLAAAMIYKRRGQAEKFPFADEAKDLVKRLERIAAGTDPLSPPLETVNDDTIAITEPSRVHSKTISF